MKSNVQTQNRRHVPLKYIHTLITLLLMFGFGFLPPFSVLTPVGMKLLGIFLGVVYGYSTCEIIWPSLFAFVAFGLSGFVPMKTAITTMMGDPLVFQIITQYFTTGAIVVYGFGKWFVRWSLTRRLFSGRPLFYTWCFMFFFMWSAVVINQIAMAILLYAVWGDIADSCGYAKNSSFRYYGCGGIFLSMVMGSAMIPYRSWMLGFTEVWAGMTGSHINFGLMFLITGLCGALIITLYVLLGAKVFKVDFSIMAAFDVEKLGEESKHLRPRAKRIIIVYLISIFLTIFAGTFTNNGFARFINETMTASGIYCLCTAVLMILPGGEEDGGPAIRFADIRHSDAAVSWPVIFMVAVTIPLASALTDSSTGVMQWLSGVFSPLFVGRSGMLVLLFTILSLMLLVNVGANIAFGTAMIPIVAPFAMSAGADPALVGIALIWITNMGFVLPGVSAPAAIFHGRGELENAGMRTRVALFGAALVLAVSLAVFSLAYRLM